MSVLKLAGWTLKISILLFALNELFYDHTVQKNLSIDARTALQTVRHVE